MIALKQAAQTLGSWRLIGCTLFVTLEPCPMCAGAIVNARVDRLVYGASDPKAGAVRTLYQICDDPRLNHRVAITAGLMAEECGELLRRFFQSRRNANS
jgi:tRNA(adenine34) deaminase